MICYTAFVNIVVMLVMLMLLFRTFVGFQDDVAERTVGVVRRYFGPATGGANRSAALA